MIKPNAIRSQGDNDFMCLQDVEQAHARIAPHINRTPLVRSDSEKLPSCYLKLETLQRTGAFKLRGALNKLLQLSDAEKQRGVVTVSTGNHGRAVSYAARMLGMQATVCMSELVPDNKRDAIAALDARIVIHGRSQDEAATEAERLVAEDGLVMVPPFDDPDILAGQATIGVEIYEDLPEAVTVLIPLSGGGLAGGTAYALKALNPDIRIIGVGTEQCPAMAESIKAGKPVDVAENESLADSLGGGIGLDNRYSFPLIRDMVDDIVLIGEDDIRAGIRHLFYEDGIVAEGAGVAGIAAMLSGKAGAVEAPVVNVVSGRNIAMRDFLRIVAS